MAEGKHQAERHTLFLLLTGRAEDSSDFRLLGRERWVMCHVACSLREALQQLRTLQSRCIFCVDFGHRLHL